MQRKEFIKSILSLTAMTTLGSFKNFTDTLKEQDKLMPVLFVGHGSPMNAIEDNEFNKGWKTIAKTIPKPTAILCISAHWETKGTFVTAMEKPKTIHDFGGFPQALFNVQYPAPGSKWLADETKKTLTTTAIGLDESWGFDHGSWSILKNLYPDADVPVVQLSLDYTKDAQYHYDLAKELHALRKKGVLIIGSGNMVHNFGYMQLKGSDFNAHFGHDWALEANEKFKTLITENDFKSLINYKTYSKALQLSAPTPEHYLPMLYTIALRDKNENVTYFNDALVAGSFSMTSLKIS
ncbi:MAG: 4,5-DOPA dioxygenase extradiol [Bacteroidota bacterium]|nr:4,5-DOPA dioxygenase extradiol [Bacteroidota bacterium]